MVDIQISRRTPIAARSRSVALRSWAVSFPARIAALYVLSRLVTTGIFLVVGMLASPQSNTGAGPDLLRMLLAWDGGWYKSVGTVGYPSTLPETGGQVQPNAWAFMPLYPMLAKVLALGNADAWAVSAVALSLACGLVATVLLAELVRGHAGSRAAVLAAVLFCLGPTGYVLQIAYAESMGLMLLFGFLLLVDRRRYPQAAAVGLALAFTRPGMQAVALFLGLLVLPRLVRRVRGTEAVPTREIVGPILLAVESGVLGFVWPAVAGIATGRPNAYLETEISWRVGYTGSAELGVFKPWLAGFQLWFGPSGALLFGAALVLTGLALASPAVRRLGPTITLFGVAWVVYALAVFYPQSSTFRILMPLAPLFAALPLRSKPAIAAAAVAAVLVQAWWLFHGYGDVVGPYSAP